LVNATKVTSGWCAVMLLAALVLTSAACLRGAEYDEQYTLFLTAGTPRPAWPRTVFAAGMVRPIQAGQASLASIAADLRATDVHPPFYFWAVSLWRAGVGPGLFQARLFSVLCGLVSLAAVGVIARRSGIRPLPSMLLTLGSYGFVYTNVIARGFAPAQALILCGVAILTGTRRWPSRLAAGVLLGAACCCNYLAVFGAVAVGALAGGWLTLPAVAPFLALDAWFFAAQHGTRIGQFPPFHLLSALPRLAAYQVASVFGGLPLYLDDNLRIIMCCLVATLALALLTVLLRARPLSGGPAIRLLMAAAVASPVGLLLLGAVFDNTPIELRYLSFGVPFIALLAAWIGDSGRRGSSFWTKPLLIMLAAVQLASIVGLMSASRTMQPARATAQAAADMAACMAGDTVVLLPRDNDGVGIVGAFSLEAPTGLPLLLVSPTDPPALLRMRTAAYRRVILALIAQDHDSTASLPLMHETFTGPDWHRVASGFNVEAYERTIDGE